MQLRFMGGLVHPVFQCWWLMVWCCVPGFGGAFAQCVCGRSRGRSSATSFATIFPLGVMHGLRALCVQCWWFMVQLFGPGVGVAFVQCVGRGREATPGDDVATILQLRCTAGPDVGAAVVLGVACLVPWSGVMATSAVKRWHRVVAAARWLMTACACPVCISVKAPHITILANRRLS